MGNNFNIFEAGISEYAVNGELCTVVIPSGGDSVYFSLGDGDYPVSYTIPGGRTVTVDDHGNILDVHE